MDSFLTDVVSQLVGDGIEKVAVGAVVLTPRTTAGGRRVLLLKRAQGEYLAGLVELPSGAVEKGEELLTALTREVKEETGLQYPGTPRYVDCFDYTSGSGRRARQLNFMVEVTSTVVTLNALEHSEFFWIKQEEVASFPGRLSAETKRTVLRAFTNAEQL